MQALTQGHRHPRRIVSTRVRSARCALLTTLALCLGLAGAASAENQATSTPLDPKAARAPAEATATPAEPRAAPNAASARTEQDLTVRGIYVQQLTAQDPKKLRRLIDEGLKVGLNTFVVDLWGRAPGYERGIKTIREAGLQYVPRITVFPHGAREGQDQDRKLLEHRWDLVDYALRLGAKDIQLDYIRFSSKNSPSPENARKILDVLEFFRGRIEQRGARLQIDIFGEVSYGPSERIGQDMARFAPVLDAVCPMLYPSHFEPYKETAKTPYRTVHGALTALQRQTQKHPIPIYAYIEHFNYRYKMSDAERAAYFEAQLEAVLDSGAQGFYVWSVGNYYDILFDVLRRRARERHERQGPPGAEASARTSTPEQSRVRPLGPPPPPQLTAAQP